MQTREERLNELRAKWRTPAESTSPAETPTPEPVTSAPVEQVKPNIEELRAKWNAVPSGSQGGPTREAQRQMQLENVNNSVPREVDDMEIMRNYMGERQRQAEEVGTALYKGLGVSSPGQMIRGKLESDYLPKSTVERLAFSIGTYLGDAPVYIAGAALGAPFAEVTGGGSSMAGAFMLNDMVHAAVASAIENGEAETPKDFSAYLKRFVKNSNDQLNAGWKGAFMGSGFAQAMSAGKGWSLALPEKMVAREAAGTAIEKGTEIGALGIMNALSRSIDSGKLQLPSKQDFIDAAGFVFVMGIGKEIKVTSKMLLDNYAVTGENPFEAAARLKRQSLENVDKSIKRARGELPPEETAKPEQPAQLPSIKNGHRMTREEYEEKAAMLPEEVKPHEQVIKEAYDAGQYISPKIFAEYPEASPFTRLMNYVEQAKKLTNKQRILQKEEKGKRLGRANATEAKAEKKGWDFNEMISRKLSQLKGTYQKVGFKGALKDEALTQRDMDYLIQVINRSKGLHGWDRLNTQVALADLFKGHKSGKAMQQNQLALLKKTFDPEYVEAMKEMSDLQAKTKEWTKNILSIPKAMRASFDFSAPLRQGAWFITRPKEFASAVKRSAKAMFSAEQEAAVREEIKAMDHFELMQETRLAITIMEKDPEFREEAFPTDWAEKFPLVGAGIRASNRAYTGFLSYQRARVFETMVNQAMKSGRDPYSEPELAQLISDYVNAGTGRGQLPARIAPMAQTLNAVLFSPRLVASRLQLLAGVRALIPGITSSKVPEILRMDPFIRKQYVRDLVGDVSVGLTVLGLAKAAGAEVGTDPTSSDFGKIIINDRVRIDIWAGFQPFIRTFMQGILNKYTSTRTKETVELGKGYKPKTKTELIGQLAEGKLSPPAALAVSAMRGVDYAGKPVEIDKEVFKLVIPLILEDFNDLLDEDPTLLPLMIPAAAGVGLQVHEPITKKPTSFKKRRRRE